MVSASSMLQLDLPNGVHGAAAAREVLVAQSKAHLDLLEGQRKLFLRSRALSLTQRALLYAHDELDMSMMRMQLRSAHDVVKLHEQHFRLQPFEVPLKNRVSPLLLERKEKTVSFCVILMRSQVSYRAAQDPHSLHHALANAHCAGLMLRTA